MSEEFSNPEPITEVDPYASFEELTTRQEWSSEIEEILRALFETHEMDLYMIYLNYKESGLIAELSEYEHRLYEWLENNFKDRD